MGIDERVSCRRLFGEQITALFVPKMSFSCYYREPTVYIYILYVYITYIYIGKNTEERVDSIKLIKISKQTLIRSMAFLGEKM